MNPTRDEPVVTSAGISTLIVVLGNALVAWLSAMGIVHWDNAQQAATNALIVAVVNVAAIALPAWWVRGQVTPEAHALEREKSAYHAGMRSAKQPRP